MKLGHRPWHVCIECAGPIRRRRKIQGRVQLRSGAQRLPDHHVRRRRQWIAWPGRRARWSRRRWRPSKSRQAPHGRHTPRRRALGRARDGGRRGRKVRDCTMPATQALSGRGRLPAGAPTACSLGRRTADHAADKEAPRRACWPDPRLGSPVTGHSHPSPALLRGHAGPIPTFPAPRAGPAMAHAACRWTDAGEAASSSGSAGLQEERRLASWPCAFTARYVHQASHSPSCRWRQRASAPPPCATRALQHSPDAKG